MRGKGAGGAIVGGGGGITPAYAGKSRNAVQAQDADEDHPRVCGEKSLSAFRRLPRLGSPPRMRGKGQQPRFLRVLCGITPAYAGKSIIGLFGGFVNGDHPRVCGEKFRNIWAAEGITGSPPRMRGKAKSPYFFEPFAGITPAYAGKSTCSFG